MNSSRLPDFRLTETWWQGIILALSAGVIVVTLWCLSHGITTVFMHLYYFPIVLLAYRYRWKGCALASLLAVVYLGLVILFDPGQTDVILGALYRVLVFVGIAAVIAWLSERLVQVQDNLGKMRQFEESVIANANVWISVLAPDGSTILIWNDAAEAISGYKKSDVMGKKTVWKQLYPDNDYRRKVTGDIRRIIGKDEFLENFETEIRCADGTKKTIVWNTRALWDNNGIVNGYIAIGRDVTAQKSAEFRAGESSRFLGTMISTLPMPIFFKDRNGKYLGCNPPFEEYIGIKMADLVGKTVYDISPGDLADKYAAADQQLFENPVPQRYETQVQYADGTRHDVIFYKAPFTNTDGTIAGLIGAFLDITDRKRAEEVLRESEEKFRLLFRHMTAGSALHELEYDIAGNPVDYRILDVNPAFERILGQKREEVIGKTGREAYGADAPPFLDTYARIVASGRPEEFEVYFAPMNKHFAISAYSPEAGRFATIFEDITDRKRAEEVLKESEEKFRAFFTTSRDCVFITTVDGSWLDFNDAAVELFGYGSREDLFRIKIPQVYANPADRDAHIRYIRENGYSFEYPVDLKKKDGTIINALITTTARKDASGSVIGFQGSIRDITEQKAIQDRMQKLLRLQEEQVRIINTSPAVAFLWRAEENWPVETVSSNISYFGYSVDDFVSGRVVYSSIIHPDDLGQVAAELESNSKNHADDFRQIYRIFGKEGSVYWIDNYIHIRRDNNGNITHYEGLILDISDRKQAENALALEKQRMESLLTLSLMGQKPDPEIIAEAIEDAIRLTGSTIGYLATLNEDESVMTMQYWSKSAHESCKTVDKPIVYPVEKTGLWGEAVRQRKPIVTNDYAADSPFKHGIPDGHVPLVRHMNIPVFDGDHIVAVAGVGNKIVDYNEGDIRQLQLLMQGWWQVTVRKRAEAALWESREHYRALIDYSQLAIAVLDVNHKIIMVNPRFSTLFKKPVEDFVGKYCYNEFEKRTAVCPHCPGVRAMVSRKPEEVDTEGILDDGTCFSARNRAVPFFGPDGAVKGFVEMVEDITERKRAEEAITRSEERYRTLAEASPDQIFINDRNGTILYANTMGLKLFGLPSDQVIGKQRKDLFPPEIVREQDATFKEVFDSGEPVRREARIRFGEQEQWIDTNLVPLKDPAGQVTAVLGVARDITGRKQMEEALRESRQILEGILNTIPVRVFWKDKELTYLGCNTPFARDAGFEKPEEVIGKNDYSMGWRDQAELYRADDRAVIESGKPKYMIEEPQTTPAGETIYLLTSKMPLLDARGDAIGILGTYLDITERKRAEEKIRESQQLFSDIISFLPDPTFVIDQDGKVLAWNRALELISGVSADDIIGRGDHEYSIWMYGKRRPILIDLVLHPDEDAGRLNYTNIQRVRHTVTAQTEISRPGVEQKITLSLVASPLIDPQGKVTGAIESMRDISRIKETEAELARINQNLEEIVRDRTQQLSESERKYRTLFDKTKDAFLIIENNRFIDCNAAALQMIGFTTKEELFQTHPSQLSPPTQPDGRSSFEKAEEMMATAMREGSHRFEWVHRRANGEDFWVEVSLTAIPIQDHYIIHTAWRDITDRKKAEKAVQDALSYTRSVIEANPDLMVVLDGKGTVLDVNTTAESLTGIPRGQLIGTNYFGYLVDDGTHTDAFRRLLETGKLQNVIGVRNLNGQVTPLSVNATLIPGRDESGARIIVAAHDITRQKQDEESIRASLDEKVILLREVHHRVKNNLQIIISLTNLQMRQTVDPAVKQIMAETQNRVRAMSLVHEKLYRSESLSRIDFADYTRYLATQLFSFYGTDTRRVQLDMSMGKIMVDINTAVPLGLLMNELISNALKHAFPDGREGTISISGGEEGDLITLVVRDDGIGIPVDFDWKNTSSLGMRLVTSLIDQVDGTITLDRENGTVFAITVKRLPSVGGEQ
jgi:PAS domain S-box-containing protein